MRSLVASGMSPEAVWQVRRALGVVDAIVWPALVAATISSAPVDTVLIGEVTLAACGIVAAQRVVRAACMPHRYRFTAWRLARLIAALLALGLVLKANA